MNNNNDLMKKIITGMRKRNLTSVRTIKFILINTPDENMFLKVQLTTRTFQCKLHVRFRQSFCFSPCIGLVVMYGQNFSTNFTKCQFKTQGINFPNPNVHIYNLSELG